MKKKLVNILSLIILGSMFTSFIYATWEIDNGDECSDDGFIECPRVSDGEDEGDMAYEYDNTNSGANLTTFEKAFQEVAYAYYMRWPYIHYNVAKGKSDILPSPEESTSQNYNYMACGLFVMNVFKELLGIDLSYSDAPYSTYGQKIGTRKEVIGYGKKTGENLLWTYGTGIVIPEECTGTLINPTQSLNPTQECIIKQLEIGDILHQAGHVMLVYDLIYDDTGNVIDAYLIHSFQQGVYYPIAKRATSSSNVIYDKTGNKVKLSIGHGPWSMLFYNIYQRSGGRLEGTIALETFKNRAKNGKNLLFDPSNKKNKYLDDYEIIRFVTTNDEWEDILNLYGLSSFKTKTINDQVVEYSDSVKSRLKYSKLYIEKTVDKRDNNIVDPGDELKYKIVIKNESNWNYEDDLIVKENIDTSLVEYLNYSYTKSWTSTDEVYLSNNVNQLQWNIGKLNSKDEVTIEYTVKVKTGHMGKIIESTGLVDNIPSGIVKNKIGRNINKWEELKQSYNNLSGNYTGKVLINKIYEEVYGINLGLDNLKILTNMSGDESGLIYFNNKWGSWSSWDDDTYMSINKKNMFSNMVLNSYFNALYKKSIIMSYNDIIVQPYVIPAIWLRKNDPDNRANTIFSTDFRTWDVLIYINKNDIRYSLSGYDTLEKYLTYENGEYAYIYIDGDFVGINLGNDGLSGTQDDRNEFNIDYYEDNGLTEYKKRGTNITVTGESKDQLEEFLHYQTLFGKDAYVILRPSLAIRNISYELDGWTNNDENSSAFMLGSDIGLKEPTKNSYVFKGWYTDPEYTNQVNNTSDLTDDVVLYAKWENNKCTFNGITVNHWESITGYKTNTVEYWGSCESESRICENWTLNWSYEYASCTVWDPATCTFNGITVNHWESVTWYRTNTAEYWGSCESESRICENWTLNWSYEYASCTVWEPATCTFNGITVNHWESVTWYRTSTVEYWGSCESESRICENWTLNWSYEYTSCTVWDPATCTFNGITVNHWESITGYKTNTVEYWGSCESESRICENWTLNWSYEYASCTVWEPATCTFNGITVNHWESVTWYRTSTVEYWGSCESESRICENWTLNWSYEYTSCTVWEPATCTFNGITVNHWESVTWYRTNTAEYWGSCESESRICENWTLNWSYEYASCTVWEPATCTFNGITVNHWESVTGYRTNTVEYWGSCESESRICENWTLNWSYEYASCTVWEPATCTFNGITVNHWESVTWYRTNTVEYWGSCESESRICENWTLNWSYEYASCTVGDPATCTFNGITVNHWESVTGYRTSTVEYWGSCESESRICENWTLNWSYEYTSCTVLEPATCTFNGITVNHWESVTWYRTNTVEYWGSCESESRICENWTLNWSYEYTSCTVWEPATCTFNGITVNHWESVTWYRTSTVEYWGSCESESRICENWTLNWSYEYASCTVGDPATCTFNGITVNHWESITGYRTSTVEYWGSCESESRICENWTLNWSYEYASCTEEFEWLKWLRKDNCPGWDFSDSYHDWKCEKDILKYWNFVPNTLKYHFAFSDEMNEAYQYSYEYNITTMPDITLADMYWNLTRIAMAKMLSNYAINVLWISPTTNKYNTFKDIDNDLDYAYDYGVQKAYQLWIMWQNMPNNEFRPYDLVTRAEFATALSRLLFNTEDGKNVYYEPHIYILNKMWIISDTNPDLLEHRWYVMIMLLRSNK